MFVINLFTAHTGGTITITTLQYWTRLANLSHSFQVQKVVLISIKELLFVGKEYYNNICSGFKKIHLT